MAAIQHAEDNDELPTIFLDKDAPERLGIGRNMVRALRFWMQATSLAEEVKKQSKTVQRLTPFGRLVWENDPYLEDDTTLWLIHHQLVSNLDQATTWFWFFQSLRTSFICRRCSSTVFDPMGNYGRTRASSCRKLTKKGYRLPYFAPICLMNGLRHLNTY